MEKKWKIFLAYLLGWLTGLIMLLVDEDKEVKRHGAQSLIVFGSLGILSFLVSIFSIILPFFTILNFVIQLVSLILWIYFLYSAITENYRIFDFLEPLIDKLVK